MLLFLMASGLTIIFSMLGVICGSGRDQQLAFEDAMAQVGCPDRRIKLDPFERFHKARGFEEWQEDRSWTLKPAMNQVAVFCKIVARLPPALPPIWLHRALRAR
jgi:hypothetical protein